jgi:predicted lipoprotein with Yx(FWY)xxD motif
VKIHGRKALPMLALPAVVAALAVAGCGSSSSSSEGSAYSGEGSSGKENAAATTESSSAYGGRYGAASTGASTAANQGAAATVSLGTASGVGKVLVDSNGMTLYYFEKDKKGSGKSTCYGPCAAGWPPMTTEGSAKAMGGVKSSMLGTIKRSDGTTQVTYAGWPLYTFVEDKHPGEDNGTDSKAFGGSWYPIHSNGKKAGH